MIKIDNVEINGWGAAIRGMRNPLASWDNSDSIICPPSEYFEDCRAETNTCPRNEADDWKDSVYCVGANDLELMKKLSMAGDDHAKYLRMINVTYDITAPFYLYKELETYKVGTVSNSCSTMHTILKKEITWEDFSTEHLNYQSKKRLSELIVWINHCRRQSIKEQSKDWWWQIIQLLPSSYNQKRTMQVNYQVLKNIYYSRKNHKLDEWKQFCEWIESLPYARELICNKSKKDV